MLPSPYSQKVLTLGILGGGQLAKMLAQAAYRMGLRVAIIEHGENTPAGMMTKLEFSNGWTSEEDLEKFIQASDIVTLENEFIDPEILEKIAERRQVFPSPATLRLVQDKFIQKKTFSDAGIPTPHFAAIGSADEAVEFGREHGFPYVMKTRKYGYDGYGNATIYDAGDAKAAFRRFTETEDPRPVMGESFVNFSKELAVIVARNRRGETVVYPCVETVQQNHICHAVLAPASIPENIRRRAQEIALSCVETIDGVGVFGIEMFLSGENVIFNEIAPRPHNSGHYTIEACHSSQFENAVRAVCNLPLGSPEMVSPAAVMINLLGTKNGIGIPDTVTGSLRHPNSALHLYGKKDVRKGRKMGHLTVVGNSLEEAFREADEAAKNLIW